MLCSMALALAIYTYWEWEDGDLHVRWIGSMYAPLPHRPSLVETLAKKSGVCFTSYKVNVRHWFHQIFCPMLLLLLFVFRNIFIFMHKTFSLSTLNVSGSLNSMAFLLSLLCHHSNEGKIIKIKCVLCNCVESVLSCDNL